MNLAPRIGAEILSVDSAAIYRGMDLGTDKPRPADRKRVPHHLLDLADIGQAPTVAEYQRAGRQSIQDVIRRGRVPLLVGGSGLYFRALVDPLEFPGTDPALRARLEAEAAEVGPVAMHRRLEEADPEAAARIEPANVRRTVRALEVGELTGRPFSSYRVAWAQRKSIYSLRVAGLHVPSEELDARIDARVDRLIAQGWVQEVAALTEGGARWSPTSLQVLGYAQLMAHLEGECSLAEAVEQIKLRTRRFARRQLKWFRADPRVRWFTDPGEAAAYLTGGVP